MHFGKLLSAAAAATILFSAGAANAGLVFVGSWKVNGGPADPAAASAQQIAAQLFGGDPADYFVSTAGDEIGAINHFAWYGYVDLSGGVLLDGESSTTFGGAPISALVGNPDIEDRFVNYAFKDVPGVGVPEPATWALMIGGFGLAGAGLRRRRAAAA